MRPVQLDSTSKPIKFLELGSEIKAHQGTIKPTQYHFHCIFHKESNFHKEFNFPFSSN